MATGNFGRSKALVCCVQPGLPADNNPQATVAFTPPNVVGSWLLDKLGSIIRLLGVKDYVDGLSDAAVDEMNEGFEALKSVTDIMDNIVALIGPATVSALLTGNLQRLIAAVIEAVSFPSLSINTWVFVAALMMQLPDHGAAGCMSYSNDV